MEFIKRYYKWIGLSILIGLIIGGLACWALFFREKVSDTVSFPANNINKEEFAIEIPQLSMEAPIIQGVDPSDEVEYNQALTGGVALMPSLGILGKSGNIVIYGHSSANEVGPYQKIFATLNNLNNSDEIKIYKDGNEYIYKVTEKKIVEATDMSILNNTENETLTLFTCWPLGTDDKRLVIFAKR